MAARVRWVGRGAGAFLTAVACVLPARAGAALPQVGYDRGFFVRSADGRFALRLGGRVAANIAFFEPGTAGTSTAAVDRARLRLDATLYEYFRLRLQNDFASGSGLRDAFVAFIPSRALALKLGQFKVPFSYEELVSKRYIDFVERAAVVSSTVKPSRDVGLMAYGSLAQGVLRYQLAVVNGTGKNRRDDNGDKDVAARLVLAPFAAQGPPVLRELEVGGAVTYGREAKGVSGKAGGRITFARNSIAGVTETGFVFFPAVARAGTRLRTGAHLVWHGGPRSLSAELVHTEESRSGVGPGGSDLGDLETDGAYIGGTWMLTGERKPRNARLHPRRPLEGPGRAGWGAWEAALRYELFRLRRAPGPAEGGPRDNRYDGVVAGLNWYPNELLRFSVNYLYGHFDRTGQESSASPGKHAASAVLARVQLEF